MRVERGLDWPALMRAGLQGLKLEPCRFWALTPAEFQLMLGAGSGQEPLLKDGLKALMDAYPDQKEDRTNE